MVRMVTKNVFYRAIRHGFSTDWCIRTRLRTIARNREDAHADNKYRLPHRLSTVFDNYANVLRGF
jgi:hypothetical protein